MERILRMMTEFEHDATPTWSGFIYQGHVAMYLAVRKICELLESPHPMEVQEIAASFRLEVENWEDVAIFSEDKQGKHYKSIHQVKNRRENNIGAYKDPIVQLLLEKSKMGELALGTPEAYLHTSAIINESETVIKQSLQDWNHRVLDFYNSLADLKDQEIKEIDKNEFQRQVRVVIEEEPIGLNRKKYSSLLKNIKSCIESDQGIYELKQNIEKLWLYLKNELAVGSMGADAKIYTYDDGAAGGNAEQIFDKIVGQVKRYKEITNSPDRLTEEQYVYIADKLLEYMRNFISNRHNLMHKKEEYPKEFLFSEVISILDNCVQFIEKKANVMALRRRYDEVMSQYCRVICKNKCEEENGCECRLLYPEYGITDLDEESFIRMCFGYNPDCDTGIEERMCIGKLLNSDGLQNSVFKVLKECPKEFFRQEKDKTRVVINDINKNAFLTAISKGNADAVIEDIVKGINKNSSMVSPVFEADELITDRLHSTDEEMWDSNFCYITERYLSAKAKENSDNIQKSICAPKKPTFVTAGEVMARLQ